MLSIKENQEFLSIDTEICMHMITFVTLWKLKKHVESTEYLESAAERLNRVIQGLEESKMSKKSSQNLYGIIVMSLAGLKISLENNLKNAVVMCEDCKGQLEDDSLSKKLIEDFVVKVSDGKERKEEWLVNELYQKILFVSTFMPLISQNTPLVRLSELESAKNKLMQNGEMLQSEVALKDNSKDRLNSSRMSGRGLKSSSRPSYSIKPWWESNTILERPVKTSKATRTRVEKQFRSEPRAYKDTSLCPEYKPLISPGLFMGKLFKPYSKESFYPEIAKEKEDSSKDTFTFDLSNGNENVECQVQLLPISMFNTRKQPLKKFKLLNSILVKQQ